MERVIRVYVCPTESCDNYYGSSNMGNLHEIENITFVVGEGSKSRGFRSKCPQCGAERVLRFARLIPIEDVAEARKKVLAGVSQKSKPST